MKRQGSVAADRGKGGRRPAARSGAARRAERRLLQFFACGSLFVLLVAIKLLMPGRVGPLSERIAEGLQRNLDVQAVFLAVGDAVSRQTSPAEALEDVYRTVFAPNTAGREGQVLAEDLPQEGSAWDILRSYGNKEQASSGEEQVAELAYILYSDENLPENVTLQQEILGFDYCTPVSAPISSPFGYREHPLQGEERFHYGVDLAAESGADVACFAGGQVRVVGESSSYGKYCIVDHENGYRTLYAHCARITVSSGTEVRRGETIAEVGETGMATGPHLHFELQRDGVYLNPTYYVSA